MEYIVPSLRIATFTNMADTNIVEERMSQLIILEEDMFIEGFHQQVKKERENAWHDRHIRKNKFQVGALVLLYDITFVKFPWKFKTHWLGPYVINNITDGGMV